MDQRSLRFKIAQAPRSLAQDVCDRFTPAPFLLALTLWLDLLDLGPGALISGFWLLVLGAICFADAWLLRRFQPGARAGNAPPAS